jgi:rRNA-processing protein FCF1
VLAIDISDKTINNAKVVKSYKNLRFVIAAENLDINENLMRLFVAKLLIIHVPSLVIKSLKKLLKPEGINCNCSVGYGPHNDSSLSAAMRNKLRGI